ncbi:maturation of 5S rRNA [Lithohypha guttulata]|uniref:Maturation of 5S rRNA n=1 Tax=Lithohypha guttulata TaxID=1690604 RepID=A0AAN7SUD4_9EURO|nr:maturation of 5S rRNA [Lithohypha guttulata]
MWLINTETLSLEYFQICPVGQYAILSHKWQDEEVTFAEFQHDTKGASRRGFWKIEKCCQQARVQGLKYAWVDTCCIDKSSSAELSEAINSMFRWYANASQCYVYMVDVISETESSVDDFTIQPWEELFPVLGYDTPVPVVEAQFCQSEWFRRGWTLQELLAPRDLLFFDHYWTYLGRKATLTRLIHKATAIDTNVLLYKSKLLTYSVAQRMSWAANRTTTRPEDIAYSLLGIFDVNMPLLYGEGEKAFLRLQHAILESSDDESLFAWTGVDEGGSGLLALSPSQFAQSGNVLSRPFRDPHRPAYSMTNKGISIQLDFMPYNTYTYLVPLRCGMMISFGNTWLALAIVLCKTMSGIQYRRVSGEDADLVLVEGYTYGSVTVPVSDQHWQTDTRLSCVYWNRYHADLRSIYVSQTPLRLRSGWGSCRIVVRNSLLHFTDLLPVPVARPEPFADGVVLFPFSPGARVAKTLTATQYQNGHQIPQLSYPFLDLAIKGIIVGFDFDSRPICMVFWDESSAWSRKRAWEQLVQHDVEHGENRGWGDEHANIKLCKGWRERSELKDDFVADTCMGEVNVTIVFRSYSEDRDGQPTWRFSVDIRPCWKWLSSFDDSRTEQRYSGAHSTLVQAFKTRLSELTDGMSKQLKINSGEITCGDGQRARVPLLDGKYDAFVNEYLGRVEWTAGPGAGSIPQQGVGA